jgi:hypothetical protein
MKHTWSIELIFEALISLTVALPRSSPQVLDLDPGHIPAMIRYAALVEVCSSSARNPWYAVTCKCEFWQRRLTTICPIYALTLTREMEQDLHGDSDKAEDLFRAALDIDFWDVEALSSYSYFLYHSRG